MGRRTDNLLLTTDNSFLASGDIKTPPALVHGGVIIKRRYYLFLRRDVFLLAGFLFLVALRLVVFRLAALRLAGFLFLVALRLVALRRVVFLVVVFLLVVLRRAVLRLAGFLFLAITYNHLLSW